MQGQIESGVQLLSRIKQASSSFSLGEINPKLFPNKIPSNAIIEISGEFSNDLLVDFLVRCILPTEINTDWRGSGVAFVNTNHHINIVKITSVIDAQLKHLNVEQRRPIIEKALSHITVLNCYDHDQIEMTLRFLERVIQERDNVNMLIVDDITSQFGVAKQNNANLSLAQFSKQNFNLLQSVAKTTNVVLLFSRLQFGDLKKTVDLHVDCKIIGEKLDSITQFIVMDYVNKNSVKVPFQLKNFINFI